MRRTTLADIAARANVSAKTVSRVVNRDPNVSADTRVRIEALIRESGFRPNMAARSLATAHSLMVGILCPAYWSFFYAELVRGAARACREAGLHLVIEEFEADEPLVERYRHGFQRLGCDRVILPPPVSDDLALLDALDGDAVHFVRISPTLAMDRGPILAPDDSKGATAAATHLWTEGYRRFGVIEGPETLPYSRARCEQFRREILRCGGQPEDVTSTDLQWHGSLVASGWHAAKRLLADRSDALAIFAFNDDVAAGVIAYARDAGLRVPADIAVVGFDDSPAASLTWPPLTTIRQPVAAIGALAARTAIGEDVSEECATLSFELVRRDSS